MLDSHNACHDSGSFTYTLTLKEGNKYDLMQAHPEVATDKVENVTDADYTREGNILTLADGRKLEYADGVIYRHNDEGNRACRRCRPLHLPSRCRG